MKKVLILAAIPVLLILVGGGIFTYRYLSGEQEETGHYQREETELIVSNLAQATMRLYRAGNNLAGAAPVPEFNGSRIWLRKGNYFLEAVLPKGTIYYPVPILGYRRGPDANGSFTITIRSLAMEDPPPPPGSASQWKLIPSGLFLLGDRQNPREPHYVWLPAFFMRDFEVTNAEFREFLRDSTGYADLGNWTEAGRRWKAANETRVTAILKDGDPEIVRFGQDDQPVTWVTWYEAQAYCRWLTQKLGQGLWIFSLPSEGEWDKAARGPDSFDYALSRSLSDEEIKLYNWKKNPDAMETVIGRQPTQGRFLPNRYGIFHLSGNVVEWTQSINRPFNRDRPYQDDDGRNREDLTETRVARGGSWYSAGIALLSVAYRDTFQPEVRHHDLGFRIVARPLPLGLANATQR